jgi:hypothetical protein
MFLPNLERTHQRINKHALASECKVLGHETYVDYVTCGDPKYVFTQIVDNRSKDIQTLSHAHALTRTLA